MMKKKLSKNKMILFKKNTIVKNTFNVFKMKIIVIMRFCKKKI